MAANGSGACPQSKTGAYVRPKYTFDGRIGDAAFPVRIELGIADSCAQL